VAYPVRVVLCLAASVTALAALPAAAMAGSISGTVTAENGGAPIGGVEVCPQRQPYTVETACTVTDGSGHYSLSGLPEGNYMLYFSADPANLKYVSEFYDNRRYPWESDLVPVGWNQNLTGLNVQLAEGGSISGVVSEEGTGNPIAGIRACASDHKGIPERCANSGQNGEYRINGLRSDRYRVEFEGGNRANYLREFYKDAPNGTTADEVEVEAPNLTPGIDAALTPGAQILGHVSDVADGGPVSGVMVCAEAQVGEFQDCDWTDTIGNYALRSLPAGTYLIAFELEYLPFGTVAEQWWQGVPLKAEATPIEISPPEVRDGIDGQVRRPYSQSPLERPPVATYEPKLEVQKSPPPKCRKGFHHKRIAGKSRCVRKHHKPNLHKHRGR
jgi:carboxypeptidase family protein